MTVCAGPCGSATKHPCPLPWQRLRRTVRRALQRRAPAQEIRAGPPKSSRVCNVRVYFDESRSTRRKQNEGCSASGSITCRRDAISKALGSKRRRNSHGRHAQAVPARGPVFRCRVCIRRAPWLPRRTNMPTARGRQGVLYKQRIGSWRRRR
eukprot:9487783-Pyramimonas_sp.AAC.1